MNELNIYTDFNYNKIRKKANFYFNRNSLISKTIFAQKEETFSISVRKKNIRICYWDICTKKGQNNLKRIKYFLEETFHDHKIGYTFNGNTNILNYIDSIKKIHLQ